ncbi:MAG: OmpA family protein [Granulosicoccus sp.]
MKLTVNKFRAFGFVSTAFSVLLLGIWSTAPAQDFTKRFYLNGGLGVTHVEPESSSDALQISDDSDAGGHLAVGFDVNRFLTVEAYAADLGQAEVEFLDNPVGDVEYQVFGISALGYLLNSRSGVSWGDDDIDGLFRREGASLYGRIGLGHMSNDSTGVNYYRDHPNHAAFGLGIEYGFTNGVALRTELMALDTDARYLNVGILKRFGRVSPQLVAAAALPSNTVSDIQPRVAAPVVSAPVVPPSIYFDFDAATLTPDAMNRLEQFAEVVKDNVLQLRIEGHTDAIATEQYNANLSEMRANVVADFLAARGISRERINAVGYGESRPVSTNDTEEGRALNRRTQIQLRR